MQEIDELKRKEIVIDLADKLISDYVFPEVGSKMAEILHTKLGSNVYNKITSSYEFAQILTDDLYAVAHDKHLRIFFSNDPLPHTMVEPPSAEEIERVRKLNGAIEKLKVLDGNVGYMRINGVPFFEGSRDAISAAFAFLHHTDALIIDNRENIGGDPRTVAWYMSYLSKGAPYLIITFQWREDNRIVESWTTDLGDLSYGTTKSVFVLTSNATFSGGEELTYDIQTFKRGLVVGAVTAGGGNITNFVQLVHNFQIQIPIGRPINPITGGNWEGVGVKPDVEVPSELALIEAHSLAISNLRENIDNQIIRDFYNVIALKLELAKSVATGKERRLDQTQILGTYSASSISVPPQTILIRDGNLYRQLPRSPESLLVPVGINRYKTVGMQFDTFLTFTTRDGEILLLMEQSPLMAQGPLILLKKI